jgi:hypothetical protein
MFILPKHDALTRMCNVSASVSFTALQHFWTENPGREGARAHVLLTEGCGYEGLQGRLALDVFERLTISFNLL